jgi:DNA processing protein
MTVCDQCFAGAPPTARGHPARRDPDRDDPDRGHLAPGDPDRAAICRHDPAYPPALGHAAGAPAVLSASCREQRVGELFGTPKVALVGEPFYSDYAHRITYLLAADLAEAGVTVTAVLCNGIDSIALDGALRAGGATLAIGPGVPGRGVRHQGRPGLDRLHERIVQTGAVVWGCRQSGGERERASMTEARRLQAAIADAVVVVEARERSIALFTAERAADLGHDVAVIPGRVTDPGGRGTFELLRDGAYPVRDANDVLELIARPSSVP